MKSVNIPFLTIVICIILSSIHTISYTIEISHKPLKILFIIPVFPKFNQTFILNQITGLLDKGHDISILARSKASTPLPPELEPYDLEEKIFYKVLPLKHYNYDIIFAQFGPEGRVGLHLKKKGVSGKLITCFRGDDITKSLTKSPTYYDELFEKGDLFLPVCDYFKEKLIEFGCPKEKIYTHHSGIALPKFKSHKKKPLLSKKKISIVTACRLIEKKGIYYAIKAVGRALKQHPTINYTIIGDGTEREKLQKLIDRLNLKNTIHLLGWKAHKEVIQEISKADIFLHPSIDTEKLSLEGIPNTIKEAMACQVPVISTYHAGIPEVIKDGISGLLVEQKKVKALTKKISEFITNPTLYNYIHTHCRAIIEQEYDSETLNNTLEQIFYDILVH